MAALRAAGHPWRLFAGPGAIEGSLATAVVRTGAARAFVICSPSVNRRTDLVRRIEAALGDCVAGVFDGIEKDSTYASVKAATQAAKAARADLLIAVGGGSVVVAARAVAVFLGEAGDPFELMTQYPDGAPAYSPRLLAPKLPIVNIPTTPTSAMNRAGSGLHNSDLDHRMEYFDPKTRPSAILLDEGALMSAPAALLRSTATTVFASLVAAQGRLDLNPLAEGDQAQAFRLGHGAYVGLMDRLEDPAPRMDLALAAFLQNRAEDDGHRGFRGGPFGGNYAVSTELHLRYPHIGQGESTSVVHASAMRLAETVEPAAATRVADALGLSAANLDVRALTLEIAHEMEAIYTASGLPTRLRDLDVAREDFPAIAAGTVKNFNANAGARSEEAQIAAAIRLLETAW